VLDPGTEWKDRIVANNELEWTYKEREATQCKVISLSFSWMSEEKRDKPVGDFDRERQEYRPEALPLDLARESESVCTPNTRDSRIICKCVSDSMNNTLN
jgi:hypothetical protein